MTVFDFSEESVVVDEVELRSTHRAGDLTVMVSRFFDNQSGVETPFGVGTPFEEFGFVDVGFEIERGIVLDMSTKFAVPKEWAGRERIDPYSVEVFVLEEGSWTALPTTFEGGSGDYFNYSISLDDIAVPPSAGLVTSPATGFGPGFGLLLLFLFAVLASVLFVRASSKSVMPILLAGLFVSVVLLSGCVNQMDVCGDGVCGVDETGCPKDCGEEVPGRIIKSASSSGCGDGTCDSGAGEDFSTCPSDCAGVNYSFVIIGQRR